MSPLGRSAFNQPRREAQGSPLGAARGWSRRHPIPPQLSGGPACCPSALSCPAGAALAPRGRGSAAPSPPLIPPGRPSAGADPSLSLPSFPPFPPHLPISRALLSLPLTVTSCRTAQPRLRQRTTTSKMLRGAPLCPLPPRPRLDFPAAARPVPGSVTTKGDDGKNKQLQLRKRRRRWRRFLPAGSEAARHVTPRWLQGREEAAAPAMAVV